MQNWKKSLEVRIQELEREIACGPDGTLVYHNSGGKCRYYVQTCSKGRRTRTYLKEEDYDLKSQLLKKKLRMILLRDYKNELRAIEPYLRERKDAQLAAVFGCAAMYDLLMEICDEWQKADYAKNPYHPEALTIEGANGVLVASKSERDITFGLKDAELANRYEQKTRLGDRDVYPDFTIFDPTNGRVVLWEHFGKMDDENYARNTYAKIDRYKKYGYFPDDNLIMTFEDKRHPLTAEKIQAAIQSHFGKWLELKQMAKK